MGHYISVNYRVIKGDTGGYDYSSMVALNPQPEMVVSISLFIVLSISYSVIGAISHLPLYPPFKGPRVSKSFSVVFSICFPIM